MKTPKRIWLIDMGDGIAWCDCPDPSDDIEQRDTCEYIKASEYKKLEKKINGLVARCACGPEKNGVV